MSPESIEYTLDEIVTRQRHPTWAETPRAAHVIRSLHRPSGRLFEPIAEKSLTESLLGLADELHSPGSRVVAVPEFVGPLGVVDLLALVVSDSLTVDRRMASGIPALLSEPDCVIVAALRPDEAMLVGELQQSVGVRPKTLQRRLQRLARVGAVTRCGDAVLRHESLQPLGDLHVFEAKVSDWRSAMHQAARYGVWADFVSIVLGRVPSDSAALSIAWDTSRAGLAHAGEWLRLPGRGRHGLARRLWAAEHVVAALAGR